MTETRPQKETGFFRLAKEFYKPHWKIFALSIAFAAITAIAVSSYGILFAQIIDNPENFQQNAAGDKSAAIMLILALVAAVIVRAGSLYANEILSNTGVQRVLVDIQNAQFKALNNGDYARLAKDNSGEWVARFINDVIAMRDAGLRVMNDFSRGTLTIIGCLSMMLYMDWLLTLTIFLIYPVAVAPVLALGRRIRKRAKSAQEQVGDLTSLLSEGFRAARIVRAFGLESYQDDRADKGFKDRSNLYLKVLMDRAAIDPILEVVGGLALAAVLGVTVWRISAGDTTIGNFVGILIYLAAASPSVRALGSLNAIVQEAGAASDRFFNIVDAPQRVQTGQSPDTLDAVKGTLAFEDVSFAYDDKTPVLQDVSFNVNPGETLALVGPSGAGKSTIFNLLLRFYDPQSGRVTLDGKPIESLTLESVRGAMALVSQDAILFDDTVGANIGLGNENASKDDIIEAAKQAHAHEFIEHMLDGYDTRVGEMGNILSGGQKQRISLARAFIRNAPILLLDEATSALDAESEAYIQEALDAFRKTRTTLIIAHRLATIRRADRILVMEDGRIVETGDFDSLVAQGGVFAKLAKLQFE